MHGDSVSYPGIDAVALQIAKPVFASRRGIGKHGGLLRLLSQHCLCVSLGYRRMSNASSTAEVPGAILRNGRIVTMSIATLISEIDAEIARLQQARTLLASAASPAAKKRGRPAKAAGAAGTVKAVAVKAVTAKPVKKPKKIKKEKKTTTTTSSSTTTKPVTTP